MRYPDHILQSIRSQLPLSQLIGGVVRWDMRKSKPAKGDYWACCPFHDEKTPSFRCDDQRERYHCFGCGESGDHFSFLMARENVNFVEAIQQLAARAGVALPEFTPHQTKENDKLVRMEALNDAASDFFLENLKGEGGRAARQYWAGRGFDPATQKEFSFGYAPARSGLLQQYLSKRGFNQTEILEAGLLGRSDHGGSVYERFRDRLMIPIHDGRGKVIGFGGRALDDAVMPKYLNSPETPLFKKNRILFNLHRQKSLRGNKESLVIVEGYLDAIALWQSGYRRVVAGLGTALGEAQIKRLWALDPEPFICFDGDEAGRRAAFSAIDRILPHLQTGRSFQFVLLPHGKDPDDLLQAGGSQAFIDQLSQAKPLSEMLLARETASARLDTPEHRAALDKRVGALVAQIEDKNIRYYYHRHMRSKLSDMFFKADRVKEKPRQEGLPAAAGALADQKLERIILGLSIQYPRLLSRHCERLANLFFQESEHEALKAELLRLSDMPADTMPHALIAMIDMRLSGVLAQVYGTTEEQEEREGPRQANTDDVVAAAFTATAHSLPSALLGAFPLLRYNPPFEVIEECFEHFMEHIEIRQFEVEIDGESEAIIRGDNPSGGWSRLQNLKLNVENLRELHAKREIELADSIMEIRTSAESDMSLVS